MSKRKSLGLTVLFLAIALFVSCSLVGTLHGAYASAGSSPALTDALHLLQEA